MFYSCEDYCHCNMLALYLHTDLSIIVYCQFINTSIFIVCIMRDCCVFMISAIVVTIYHYYGAASKNIWTQTKQKSAHYNVFLSTPECFEF